MTEKDIMTKGYNCELFSPLEGPGSLRGGNPPKMGKNYKICFPGLAAKNGEKCPKKEENYSENTILVIFLQFFRDFGGRTGEANFVIFALFFGDFRPGGFPGSVRGKTTRKARTEGQSDLVLGKTHENPGLVNQFLAPPRGQPNCTGTIANSSDHPLTALSSPLRSSTAKPGHLV